MIARNNLALRLAMLGVVIAASACARPKPAPTPLTVTSLDVVNEGVPDMDVYVVGAATPSLLHLGVAAGSLTTTMIIPDSVMLNGVNTLKFVADPVGRVRTSVSSTIVVHRGDIVTLRIPAG